MCAEAGAPVHILTALCTIRRGREQGIKKATPGSASSPIRLIIRHTHDVFVAGLQQQLAMSANTGEAVSAWSAQAQLIEVCFVGVRVVG